MVMYWPIQYLLDDISEDWLMPRGIRVKRVWARVSGPLSWPRDLFRAPWELLLALTISTIQAHKSDMTVDSRWLAQAISTALDPRSCFDQS